MPIRRRLLLQPQLRRLFEIELRRHAAWDSWDVRLPSRGDDLERGLRHKAGVPTRWLRADEHL
jgi:hypothetical protein